MTKIIFLRHAETEKNPNINPKLWGLSKEGEDNAKKLLDVPELMEVDKIYSSSEKKAFLTVKPIADALSKKIEQLSFFDEVKRGDKFLSKEDFEKEKLLQLEDIDYHAFNGESGREALLRFKEGVKKIEKENEGRIVIITTHGTILNLYFADLLNVYDEIFQRWGKTNFCSYGIIEKSKVMKDIVQ
jgi:2,3-bisphosphoglycerate-dependent phosphoglycerate mutase